MLSNKLLEKLNKAARNTSVSQIIVYNSKTDEGLLFDREAKTLSCVCPFCMGQNIVITKNHINIYPSLNGFLKNFPSDQIGLSRPGRKPAEAHGTDNAKPSATDTGNPVSI